MIPEAATLHRRALCMLAFNKWSMATSHVPTFILLALTQVSALQGPVDQIFSVKLTNSTHIHLLMPAHIC